MTFGITLVSSVTSQAGSGSVSMTGTKVGDIVLRVYFANYSGGGYEDHSNSYEPIISTDDHIQQTTALAASQSGTVILLRQISF